MDENSQLHQPQRLEGESFESYKARRKSSHQLNKMTKRGFLFWNTSQQGTFRKNKEN